MYFINRKTKWKAGLVGAAAQGQKPSPVLLVSTCQGLRHEHLSPTTFASLRQAGWERPKHRSDGTFFVASYLLLLPLGFPSLVNLRACPALELSNLLYTPQIYPPPLLPFPNIFHSLEIEEKGLDSNSGSSTCVSTSKLMILGLSFLIPKRQESSIIS